MTVTISGYLVLEGWGKDDDCLVKFLEVETDWGRVIGASYAEHLYEKLTPKRSRLNNQCVHSHEAQSCGEK